MKRTFVFVVAALFVFLGVVSTSSAKELFSRTFVRGTGTPVTETVTFNSTDGPAVVKLTNGNATDSTIKKVSSSMITLNGSTIFGPANFNQHVSSLESPVSLLIGKNTLTVLLKGNPGGQISIQIDQEEKTKYGYSALSVGDLGIVSLTTNNEFSYEITEGQYAGQKKTVQLYDSGNSDLDGHMLYGSTVPIFFKFAKGGIGAYLDDEDEEGVKHSILISKLNNNSALPILDGDYNAFLFALFNLDLSVPSFKIEEGKVTVTKDGNLNEIFNLTEKQNGSNILQAADDQGNTKFNLIVDGNGMIIDIPQNGYYQSEIGGFGTAIKAIPVDLSEIIKKEFPETDPSMEGKRKFYAFSFSNKPDAGTIFSIDIIYGILNPIGSDTLGYEIYRVSDEYSELIKSGTFVFGPQPTTCGGVSLPNQGRGWGCDNGSYDGTKYSTGYAITIDPVQGLLAVAEYRDGKSNGIWIGGW